MSEKIAASSKLNFLFIPNYPCRYINIDPQTVAYSSGYADDAEGNPGLWRENGTAPGIPRIGRQGSGHHTQSAGAET
ncbi:unnamed protein product [Nesidiocoris tenuis]|uniref:Uncharacterized protein n=1 Tax=Nesidiocoris tenuis TaxID=355587 RepID=A0A6H5FWM5_9HEMI|nr:unnamed protein product [Nesidiocoris tenuis]